MGVRQWNEKEELRAAMWFQGNFFFARSGSVRATFFLCTKFILKTKSSGATRARSLCFIIRTHGDKFSQTKAASGLNRSTGCVEILYGL